ncbi:serine carboxypeptidase S28 [Xylaria intraflava]|nr:serine carboxypeptidase S28 [Xylaria intraflava]
MGNSTFDQLLDHKHPEKGTFKQRYWWNAEFYETEGPIFLFTPGETDASGYGGYLMNDTLPGYYAQQFKGAVIILEHRYWGKSVPFDTLTAETLQYLNLPNSIHDLTNFAQNVSTKFCDGGNCNSNKNPWVMMGGSYSGALTAWTSQLAPNVFHAYHASSAVVEAIYDFWEYYEPIEAALPRNCSTDIKSVIRYVDTVLAANKTDDVNTLKNLFGLSALNNADFASVLSTPFSYWQSDEPDVIKFCNYLGATSSEKGVSSVDAYASYIKENSECGKDGVDCDTYSPNIEWNTPNQLDDNRPWQWMLCNEPFGWYQVGPPVSNGTSIVSSALRPDYYQRRCPLMFPETNGSVVGSVRGFTEEHLNMWTKGWDAPYERVLFVNGAWDPWMPATIASTYRPGGPVKSSQKIPSFIVEHGDHVPDFIFTDGNSKYQTPVVEAAVKIMGTWLQDWNMSAGKRATA